MNEELKLLLHRAVQELASVHTMACECVNARYMDSIVSSEGEEIVEEGMRLLGLKDLSDDSIVGKHFSAQRERLGEMSTETSAEKMERINAMIHDHGRTWDFTEKDEKALYHMQSMFYRALSILSAAELDCRGYEALHGWVEDAAEFLGEIDPRFVPTPKARGGE